MRVRFDAPTIIALARAGRLEVLRKVAGPCTITPGVRAELLAKEDETSDAIEAALGPWIGLARPRAVPARCLRIGRGTGDASLVAAAASGDVVVIDGRQGRALAHSLGLRCVGLVGLVIEGARSGRISPREAKETLDAVERKGFWIASDLRRFYLTELERVGR